MTRRDFLRIARNAAVGSALAGGLTTTGYATLFEPNRLKISRTSVPIKWLPPGLDGLRIVLMSDFHLFPFTSADLIQHAIRQADTLQPDIVLFAGDFVYSEAEAAYELSPILAQLNSKLGSFAVLGNHDHVKGAAVVQHALTRSGIEVLNNRGVTLSVGLSDFYLAGMDSMAGGAPNVRAAFAARRGNAPTLVLAHEPDTIDYYSQRAPIDLQLSGHSHGGQIRLPGIGPVILPLWGRRYPRGLYQVKDSQLFTSQGIGTVDLPVRINCPPEIAEITLTC
jgi:predicted MPP superfamily phosphohydrolase